MSLNFQQCIELLCMMLCICGYEECFVVFVLLIMLGICILVGQEVCVVGVVVVLQLQDCIFSNYCSGGYLLVCGVEFEWMMVEVFGCVIGYCGGVSGLLYIVVKEFGVVMISIIVGGELVLVFGVVLVQKLGVLGCELGGIVIVFFGDGVVCEGIFYEVVNLVVVWQLLLLFVCENNQWQVFVWCDEMMLMLYVVDWVCGYGLVEVCVVDGNVVEIVYEVVLLLVEVICVDGCLCLFEFIIWCQCGYFEFDDCVYVDVVEVVVWQVCDLLCLQVECLWQDGLFDEVVFVVMCSLIDVELDVVLVIVQVVFWFVLIYV